VVVQRTVNHIALTIVLTSAGLLAGCAGERRALTPTERAIEAAARPILELDPDAVWTDCFNRLLDLAPASIAYLADHPRLQRPAAPDDLRVLVHAGLLRLLLHPARRPQLSATCLETTLEVLHFEIKVRGEPVGTLCWPQRSPPAAWHDLYPAEFDHALGSRIDAEADRTVMRRWWLEFRDRPYELIAAPRLAPQPEPLWRLLGRRWADRWTYLPQPRATRCFFPPDDQTLLSAVTYDYNVVRATCVWLGASGSPDVCDRLINLVGSPSPLVAHNARFALQYARDERIRNLLERYKHRLDRPPGDEPAEPGTSILTWRASEPP
jgi:hypothetical protein